MKMKKDNFNFLNFKMYREKKEDVLEEWVYTIFYDIPYWYLLWYRTEFEQRLFFRRFQYILNNIEPFLSIFLLIISFCYITAFYLALWLFLKSQLFLESFYVRVPLFYFFLAVWFEHFTFSIFNIFFYFQSLIQKKMSTIEQIKTKKKVIKSLKIKNFSTSSYYPEHYVEEEENEKSNWLEKSELLILLSDPKAQKKLTFFDKFVAFKIFK